MQEETTIKGDSRPPFSQRCLQFISIDLCILGALGILCALSTLAEINELDTAHESGSSYLGVAMFFPIVIVLLGGLIPGILGCFVVFKQKCLIPSCVVGGIWSALALYYPGRYLVLLFNALVESSFDSTSMIGYLFVSLVVLIALLIPFLWTAMTIVYVRSVRKEQKNTAPD